MIEFTTNMKTHCVGRCLIDMPADAKAYGRGKVRGIKVEVEPMTQQEFLQGMPLIGSAKIPRLSFDLQTGVLDKLDSNRPRQASIKEGAAMGLWDAVSRTIRLRPGAMDLKEIPISRSTWEVAPVRSGQLCTESGRWHGYCEDKWYRRDFLKGERMTTIQTIHAVPYSWLPARINA